MWYHQFIKDGREDDGKLRIIHSDTFGEVDRLTPWKRRRWRLDTAVSKTIHDRWTPSRTFPGDTVKSSRSVMGNYVILGKPPISDERGREDVPEMGENVRHLRPSHLRGRTGRGVRVRAGSGVDISTDKETSTVGFNACRGARDRQPKLFCPPPCRCQRRSPVLATPLQSHQSFCESVMWHR